MKTQVLVQDMIRSMDNMKLKIKRWVNTPQYNVPIAEFYYLDRYGKCGVVNELQLDWVENQRPDSITERFMLKELGQDEVARKHIYSYLKKARHENAIKFAPIKKVEGGINDAMIARAKDVPIDKLIDIGRNNIECLWHDDRSPSLSYHKKGNFVKCFACDEWSDSIGVYKKINNCDFKTAVIEMQ